MPSDGQMDSPFKPCHPAPNPAAKSGDFYGPNMPAAIAGHAPTQGSEVSGTVQFGPGGFAPGPLESPFTTALPIDSTQGGGGGQATSGIDSPFKTPMKR